MPDLIVLRLHPAEPTEASKFLTRPSGKEDRNDVSL